MSTALTVIVKGVDGKLVEGAHVTVSPGNVTGTTNPNGEATVTIDGANKYQVKVVVGSESQTVPFYATSDNTARLEVDLAYLKQLKSAHKTSAKTTIAAPTPWYQTTPAFMSGGILLLILIVLVVIVVARRTKRHKKLHHNVPEHGRSHSR